MEAQQEIQVQEQKPKAWPEVFIIISTRMGLRILGGAS